MNQSNCMVAQSGGPTAAINASLAGVISGIKKSGKYDTCYGAINGILGILNERYLNLSQMIPDEKTLNRLKVTPAMYLGSCRHKLPNYKDDDSAYVFIFNQFAKLNIKAFFYIGGNDSMDTVLKLSDYAAKIKSDIRIIGRSMHDRPHTRIRFCRQIHCIHNAGNCTRYVYLRGKKRHYRRNYGARCRMAHCCQRPGAK